MRKNLINGILLLFGMIIFSSCSTDPQPISFGTDNCDFCKMTISDARYGAEIVTKKGRTYKFDDLHCIKGFIEEGTVVKGDIHAVWLVDFDGNGQLIPAENSFLLQNEALNTPMGSNAAAFANQEKMEQYISEHGGNKLTWQEFLQLH